MPEKYKKCFRINIKQEFDQKTVDNIMLAGVYYTINKRSGNDDDSFYQELTSFFCVFGEMYPCCFVILKLNKKGVSKDKSKKYWLTKNRQKVFVEIRQTYAGKA